MIAPVERTVSCATIASPATAAEGFVIPRLDEPVDVAAVQLVVPPGPAGRRARCDQRDRVDQVGNRQPPVVEPQAEDPG